MWETYLVGVCARVRGLRACAGLRVTARLHHGVRWLPTCPGSTIGLSRSLCLLSR